MLFRFRDPDAGVRLSAIRAMEARMRAADRLASLGRMAANIAHEIEGKKASLRVLEQAVSSPAVRAALEAESPGVSCRSASMTSSELVVSGPGASFSKSK